MVVVYELQNVCSALNSTNLSLEENTNNLLVYGKQKHTKTLVSFYNLQFIHLQKIFKIFSKLWVLNPTLTCNCIGTRMENGTVLLSRVRTIDFAPIASIESAVESDLLNTIQEK